MPPGTFFRRMEMLKTGGYQVLTLADGVSRLFNGTLPPRSVAITFDDGMYDFRRQALPILTEFGFPATVYLTTFYAEHNRPVFQLLCSYLLWKRRGYLLRKGLPGINSDLSLVTAADRARALGIIEEFAARENLSATDKDALARELADRLRLNYSDIQRERILHLVNPTEVGELYKKGVDVQLHTHRHRVPAEHSLFTEELRANSARIRSWTGETPAHFCYPDGRHSSNSLASLRRLGIASAVTCEPGLACRRDDSLLLPRFVDTHCSSELEFESWLAGAASFLPRRRPAFRPPAARSAA
jgi:peptidoglycan/xylan/chitin deacetylase (PgdA/CDA1 family)